MCRTGAHGLGFNSSNRWSFFSAFLFFPFQESVSNTCTLPETNSSHLDKGLGNYFSFGKAYFEVLCHVSFGEGSFYGFHPKIVFTQEFPTVHFSVPDLLGAGADADYHLDDLCGSCCLGGTGGISAPTLCEYLEQVESPGVGRDSMVQIFKVYNIIYSSMI